MNIITTISSNVTIAESGHALSHSFFLGTQENLHFPTSLAVQLDHETNYTKRTWVIYTISKCGLYSVLWETYCSVTSQHLSPSHAFAWKWMTPRPQNHIRKSLEFLSHFVEKSHLRESLNRQETVTWKRNNPLVSYSSDILTVPFIALSNLFPKQHC